MKKMRQSKKPEPGSDSIRTGKALVSRIRSSQSLRRLKEANFGFERTLENYNSGVVFVQKFS